jgi:hypothetical protein
MPTRTQAYHRLLSLKPPEAEREMRGDLCLVVFSVNFEEWSYR